MRSIASTSPVGLAGELVRAVAGADGDGQGVDAGVGDEPLGLVRIGQQLVVRETPSAPWPSSFSPWPYSSEPRQPSSPSTDTPWAWASSTTSLRHLDVVLEVGRASCRRP